DAGTLSDAELVARTDARHVRICSEQLDQLRDFVHIDTRRLWQRDGCRDMAGWISGRYGYSPWEARRWTAAAHSLENLTLISDALAAGRLSLPKVLELARFADPETEKKLVSWAKRVSPRTIRRRADRETRPDPEDAKEAERGRFVRWWFDDNTMWLEGRFPAAQGAGIAKAVQRFADQLPEIPDDDLPEDVVVLDDDLVDQRRADALYLIASTHSATDADEDRATVVVHKKLPDASDPREWTELDRGVVLDPEVGRRISCDARLQFVLTDADGNPLGIGRTSRDVPLWLERLVRERDGWECSFAGCGMTTFLKSHHIWHWEDGGPTDLSNLVTVCHAHHKLVHEFGWRVRLNGSIPEWFRPNGRRFDPGPDPPNPLQLDPHMTTA
ncbi:MAG: HNH endonuclease, partial [Actinobacteria bacterium]|nr:HNH endonuclease [Actinomycetota bacterium]